MPATPERPVGLQFDQVEKRYGTVYALRSASLRGSESPLRDATAPARRRCYVLRRCLFGSDEEPSSIAVVQRKQFRGPCPWISEGSFVTQKDSALRSAQDKVVAPAVFDNIISGYPRVMTSRLNWRRRLGVPRSACWSGTHLLPSSLAHVKPAVFPSIGQHLACSAVRIHGFDAPSTSGLKVTNANGCFRTAK